MSFIPFYKPEILYERPGRMRVRVLYKCSFVVGMCVYMSGRTVIATRDTCILSHAGRVVCSHHIVESIFQEYKYSSVAFRAQITCRHPRDRRWRDRCHERR